MVILDKKFVTLYDNPMRYLVTICSKIMAVLAIM